MILKCKRKVWFCKMKRIKLTTDFQQSAYAQTSPSNQTSSNSRYFSSQISNQNNEGFVRERLLNAAKPGFHQQLEEELTKVESLIRQRAQSEIDPATRVSYFNNISRFMKKDSTEEVNDFIYSFIENNLSRCAKSSDNSGNPTSSKTSPAGSVNRGSRKVAAFNTIDLLSNIQKQQILDDLFYQERIEPAMQIKIANHILIGKFRGNSRLLGSVAKILRRLTDYQAGRAFFEAVLLGRLGTDRDVLSELIQSIDIMKIKDPELQKLFFTAISCDKFGIDPQVRLSLVNTISKMKIYGEEIKLLLLKLIGDRKLFSASVETYRGSLQIIDNMNIKSCAEQRAFGALIEADNFCNECSLLKKVFYLLTKINITDYHAQTSIAKGLKLERASSIIHESLKIYAGRFNRIHTFNSNSEAQSFIKDIFTRDYLDSENKSELSALERFVTSRWISEYEPYFKYSAINVLDPARADEEGDEEASAIYEDFSIADICDLQEELDKPGQCYGLIYDMNSNPTLLIAYEDRSTEKTDELKSQHMDAFFSSVEIHAEFVSNIIVYQLSTNDSPVLLNLDDKNTHSVLPKWLQVALSCQAPLSE